jgi:uncharacterized protein (DUF305 family)
MRLRWPPWRWSILLALFLVSALAWAPSTLAAATPRFQQMHPMGGQSLDQLSGDAFDQAFLTQMTMHHAMGVMMTQPVAAGGDHPELKSLGAQMIADQSREIEQMRGWLQGWYGQDVSCPMMPGLLPAQQGARPGAGPMRPGGMMPGPAMPMMPGVMPGGPTGMPMTGMPMTGMPMTGMPMTGMPMTGMPMTGMPMMGGFWGLPPDQLDATFMTWMIAHHQGAIDMAALAQERAAHPEVKDLATSIMTTQSAEIETMRGWLAEWYGR